MTLQTCKATMCFLDDIDIWSASSPPDIPCTYIYAHLNNKKRYSWSLGIINFLGKFLLLTGLYAIEVYKPLPLQALLSTMNEWMWNTMSQKLYKRKKSLVKNDACMVVYNKEKQLYLETEIFGVGLQVSLLQVKGAMLFLKNKASNNTTL